MAFNVMGVQALALVVLSGPARVGYTFESRPRAPANPNSREGPEARRCVSSTACCLPHLGRKNRGGVFSSAASGLAVCFSIRTPHAAQHPRRVARIVTWGNPLGPRLGLITIAASPLFPSCSWPVREAIDFVFPPFFRIALRSHHHQSPPSTPSLILALLVSRVRRADDVQVAAMSLAALAADDLIYSTY